MQATRVHEWSGPVNSRRHCFHPVPSSSGSGSYSLCASSSEVVPKPQQRCDTDVPEHFIDPYSLTLTSCEFLHSIFFLQDACSGLFLHQLVPRKSVFPWEHITPSMPVVSLRNTLPAFSSLCLFSTNHKCCFLPLRFSSCFCNKQYE